MIRLQSLSPSNFLTLSLFGNTDNVSFFLNPNPTYTCNLHKIFGPKNNQFRLYICVQDENFQTIVSYLYKRESITNISLYFVMDITCISSLTYLDEDCVDVEVLL